MSSLYHTVPVLRVEEWPLPGDSLTGDTVRALIDRVSQGSHSLEWGGAPVPGSYSLSFTKKSVLD